MNEKTVLRARDFWTSIVLIIVSLFLLYKTFDIPFLNTKAAGVNSAQWYNSAALVPYGIFISLLILALILMFISFKDGGAKHALSLVGIGFEREEVIRLCAISIILFFYIFGLVPRGDFIISSALLITSLIWGFYSGEGRPKLFSTIAMSAAGLYAMIVHFPRDEWAKPHDDDWVTLAIFIALTIYMLVRESSKEEFSRVVKLTPVISVLVPFILVMAMAFGFRQNVPNRTGLLFSKIEYHYYVTLKPLWQGKK